MVNLEDLQRAARIETDKEGQPVIQIPLKLWEDWLTQGTRPQNRQLLALLDEWDAKPDDTPAEWWDEFQAFLKAN